jgi:thioredoxin-like negative regulator of GroEL
LAIGFGAIAMAACAGTNRRTESEALPESFYTVTAELALARHEPRVAAVQYAAAAERDHSLLPRAVEVAAETLQPSLGLATAERWIKLDPDSLEAQRAAGNAALELYKIEQSAAHYRFVIAHSPDGVEAEFGALEKELRNEDDPYGVRQLADHLAGDFPTSAAALRLQGFAALRADDPAAAVRSFEAALARPGEPGNTAKPGDPAKPADAAKPGDAAQPAETATAAAAVAAAEARRDLTDALLRARVLSGEVEGALAEAAAQVAHDDTPENQFAYSLLLWAAKRDAQVRERLKVLLAKPDFAPDALRVLALLEFQAGNDDAAGVRFAELLATGRYVEDGFYYLGLIAERHADFERALRWYSRVQSGDNTVPALLRAAAILHAHGAESTADELLDRLLEDEPSRAPEIIAGQAQIYVQAGDPARAITLLDGAMTQYPDSVELRYARATSYEQQGRVDVALRELAAIAEARPDDPAALNALGYTLADHSRHLSRARALVERAYAAAPKSAAIRDSLGWVLYRQGNVQAALPLLSGAYADEPGGDIGAHLGEVLWQLGRQSDAERIWSEASRIDSDDRLLKATRRRLHAEKPAGG